MNRRRAVAVVAAALVLGGCGHRGGTDFCGTHVETGEESVLFTPLDPTVPAPPGPPPAASVLPAKSETETHREYVQTAPTCKRGATVEVVPASGARLVEAVSGPGGYTGVVLNQIVGTVHVYAWVDGRYAGGLTLGR